MPLRGAPTAENPKKCLGGGSSAEILERFSITFTAKGKRQTSDSRLRFLKINYKCTRIEKSNSGVYD